MSKRSKKNKNKQINQSNLSSKLTSDLKQKLNTENRVDVSEKERELLEKEAAEQKEEKLTFKQKWANQKIDKEVVDEVKDWKRHFKNSLWGSLFASNSIVYGSSTSIYAYQSSYYEKLLDRFCGLFSPKSFLDFCWKLLWALPFLLVFILTCVCMYAIDSALYASDYQLAIIFFFVGLNVVGLMFLLLIPKTRPTNLINKNGFRDNDFQKTWHLITCVAILVVILAVAFVARFAWNQGYPSSSHINFNQYTEIVGGSNQQITSMISQNNIDTAYALEILFASFLCGCTTFIPGLSGSFMLAVIGSDSLLNTATRFALGGYTNGLEINSNWAWSTVVIALIGLIAGFATSCFVGRYLYTKQKDLLNTIAFSSMLITIVAVLISLQTNDYRALGRDGALLGTSLALLFIPIIGGSAGLYFYSKKKNLSFAWMWK